LTKVLFLLVLLSFVSCNEKSNLVKPSPKQELVELRENVIGWWYGKIAIKDSSNKREWLTENRKDGTYTITFKDTRTDGAFHEHQETGIWGVSPGFIFKAVRGMSFDGKEEKIDLTDAVYYDLYKIKAISPKTMNYQNMETGTEYEVEKVNETFNL
jgi:hypothetical protein